MSTTRRKLLTSGAAALTALAGAGVTSRLFGRGKAETPVASRAPKTAREIERVLSASSEHWVGDGFRVRSVISPNGDPILQSPFLLLDHAARRYFEPAALRRGVGEHPHRGFETVTFAYRGEIQHRDSSGGGGLIGPGDVQWMTAAGGLVHEEMHSHEFTARGGELEMVQLWVNLPAKSKLSTPGYQPLLGNDFPRLTLGAARARLIAGKLGAASGPARTHTPITVFDLEFGETGETQFALPSGWNSLLFNLEGDVRVGAHGRPLRPGDLARLDPRSGGRVHVQGVERSRVLVLSGEPIAEPVAAYGPFVMNTQAEIQQAIEDYRSGKMGRLG